MLAHYQDHRAGGSNGAGDKDGKERGEASFAQSGGRSRKDRIRCYVCKEFGHVKRDCPKLAQSHMQDGEDEDSESGRRHVRRSSSRARAEWSG